jgi:serine/threonine protein kinase/tetratricopeptide (TPR) repeat protein
MRVRFCKPHWMVNSRHDRPDSSLRLTGFSDHVANGFPAPFWTYPSCIEIRASMTNRSARDLFNDALAMPEPERTGWLDSLPIMPDVRARVHSLLAAEAASQSPLDMPFPDQLQALTPTHNTETTGTWSGRQIGNYTLGRLLGQGGMASVFEGQRVGADFVQRVAVKVLRRALHTDLELRLFQRERQALAALEHPNIARLLDGGITVQHVPYLVMEFVDGIDLLRYAQREQLPPRARLALFVQVCDAVNAAHRALIVHRDIKPSNILVTDEGNAKLLDFGIAKILGNVEDTQPTTFAPMTPEYAAPEQMSGGSITTATDVYGLGVVLYELLTGIRPARGDRARASDVIDVHTTLRSSKHSANDTALKRFLRGDIDNILRKSLVTDPVERYASAGELAADLRRFLEGQPVQAHPPSGWYRTQKFVRRNRLVVLLAMMALTAVLLSTVFAWRKAEVAQLMTIQAEARAVEAREQAQLARAAMIESDAVQSFLYDIIRGVNPNVALDSPETMREVMDQAESRLESELQAEPNVQIEIYGFLRQVREQFGDNPRAIELGKRQLALASTHFGAHHEKTAASQYQLARLMIFAGDDAGFEMMQASVRELEQVAPEGLNLAYALVSFAGVLSSRGRSDEAFATLRRASPLIRTLCDEGLVNACEEQVTALSHLGIALYQRRDYIAAAAAFTEGVARAQGTYGDMHSITLRLRGNLATCQVQIDPAAAIVEMRKVIALTEQLPEVAIDTIPAQYNGLALALSRAGRGIEATAMFREAIQRIDASQQHGPQQKIFSLNLVSELILLGDLVGARTTLKAAQSLLAETEENFLHLARAAESAAWLDALADAPANVSYRGIDEALKWRYREANPRLSDIVKSVSLGLRIAARHRDRAQAANYQQRIATLLGQIETLPDSAAQELWLARFEIALALGDSPSLELALKEYAARTGEFSPNAAFDQLQLLRMQRASAAPDGSSAFEPSPAWISSLRARMGDSAPIVRAVSTGTRRSP